METQPFPELFRTGKASLRFKHVSRRSIGGHPGFFFLETSSAIFFRNLWSHGPGGFNFNGAGGFQKNGARDVHLRLSLIGLAEQFLGTTVFPARAWTWCFGDYSLIMILNEKTNYINKQWLRVRDPFT